MYKFKKMKKVKRWFVDMSKKGPLYSTFIGMIRLILQILIQCNVLESKDWFSKPQKVTSFRVESETAKSIVLRWTVEKKKEKFYDPWTYQVQIKTLSGKTWKDIYCGCNTRCIHPISNEKGETRVRVKNITGFSEWSEIQPFESSQIPVKQGGYGPNKIYQWDQNSKFVHIRISLSLQTRSKDIDIGYDSTKICVSLKRDVLFQGKFYDKVKSESEPWTLDSDENGRVVNLFLEKKYRSKRRVDLWPCVLKGHPKIDMGLVFHRAGVPTQFFPGDEEIKYDDDYFDGMN